MKKLVLFTIRSVVGFVKNNEEDFIRLVREASQVQQEETVRGWKKRLAKNEKRIAELDMLIRRIYEDKVKGSLTEKRFEILSRDYESEQETLEHECFELREEIDRYTADTVRADKFIELANRYKDFTELTPQILNEFIEKIIAHESDKSSGERVQQVDIFLNFIGKFEVPEECDGLTEAEREEQKRIAEKRARQRAYSRRWYAKKRQGKEQTLQAREQ